MPRRRLATSESPTPPPADTAAATNRALTGAAVPLDEGGEIPNDEQEVDASQLRQLGAVTAESARNNRTRNKFATRKAQGGDEGRKAKFNSNDALEVFDAIRTAFGLSSIYVRFLCTDPPEDYGLILGSGLRNQKDLWDFVATKIHRGKPRRTYQLIFKDGPVERGRGLLHMSDGAGVEAESPLPPPREPPAAPAAPAPATASPPGWYPGGPGVPAGWYPPPSAPPSYHYPPPPQSPAPPAQVPAPQVIMAPAPVPVPPAGMPPEVMQFWQQTMQQSIELARMMGEVRAMVHQQQQGLAGAPVPQAAYPSPPAAYPIPAPAPAAPPAPVPVAAPPPPSPADQVTQAAGQLTSMAKAMSSLQQVFGAMGTQAPQAPGAMPEFEPEPPPPPPPSPVISQMVGSGATQFPLTMNAKDGKMNWGATIAGAIPAIGALARDIIADVSKVQQQQAEAVVSVVRARQAGVAALAGMPPVAQPPPAMRAAPAPAPVVVDMPLETEPLPAEAPVAAPVASPAPAPRRVAPAMGFKAPWSPA